MGLGWLRLLLSLLVMDAHFEGFRGHLQPLLLNRFGMDRLSYIGSGGVAVTGFFVISGYVIAYVLARKYDTWRWGGIGRFYLGRALRIYPLYWLVLGAYGLILIALDRAPPISASALVDNLLLLPYALRNSFVDFQAVGALQLSQQLWIGPAWTLTLDLLLYAVAPFLFVRRDTTWLVWLIGLAYGLAFAGFSDPRPPLWFAYFYSSTPPYVFAFASGALVFHYRDRPPPGPGLTGLAIGLIAVLLWVPLGFTNTPLNQVLLTLAFAVWVARLSRRPRTGRGEQLAGDLTYATYLIHVPILHLLQGSGFPYPVPATVVLSYGLGLLLVHGFEYPLDHWRESLHARGQGVRRSVAASAALTGGTIVDRGVAGRVAGELRLGAGGQSAGRWAGGGLARRRLSASLALRARTRRRDGPDRRGGRMALDLSGADVPTLRAGRAAHRRRSGRGLCGLRAAVGGRRDGASGHRAARRPLRTAAPRFIGTTAAGLEPGLSATAPAGAGCDVALAGAGGGFAAGVSPAPTGGGGGGDSGGGWFWPCPDRAGFRRCSPLAKQVNLN